MEWKAVVVMMQKGTAGIRVAGNFFEKLSEWICVIVFSLQEIKFNPNPTWTPTENGTNT